MSKLYDIIKKLCPNGVEYVKLGEVCEIRGRIGFRGYTRRDLVSEPEGAITLSPSNIVNGNIVYDKCSYVSWKKYEESPEIMAEIGDVVFTKTASVGKTAYIESMPKEMTINPQLVLLKKIKGNSKYLSYILKTTYFQNEVKKITGVGSVPNVPQSSLAKIEIPLPPIEVQNEIVRILDCFTQLEAELEAELDCRKRQYEFYRDQLLSFDKITPPERNNVVWMPITEVFEMRNGYTPSKNKPEYWEGGKIPWFRMEDIRQNGRILSDSIQHITMDGVKKGNLFKANSFILATTATIGEHALVIADSLANQQFTNLSVRKSLKDRIIIKFLFHYMFIIDDWCKNNVNISGFASVDMNKFKKLEIPIPPIEEQNRIVAILDRFESLTTSLQHGLPAEIAARRQQYEYYRDKLLDFKRKTA